jgi:hypothetical protein
MALRGRARRRFAWQAWQGVLWHEEARLATAGKVRRRGARLGGASNGEAGKVVRSTTKEKT